MRSRTAGWIAWLLLGLDVVVTAVGLWLVVLNRRTALPPGASSVVSDAALLLAFLPFAVTGALIFSRRPGNRIGLIFLISGIGMAVGVTAFEYAVYAVLTNPNSLPGGEWSIRVSEWGFGLPFLAYLFLFLMFPTGHLPSRRWLPIASLAVLAIAALEASEFAPTVIPFELARALTVLALCASAAAPVIRFRNSGSDERQQIKWFTFAAVPAVAVFIGPLFFNPSGLYLPVAFLATVGVAVGAWIAIFKYRLYDIDVILNKTLVYGGLAVFITVVYVVVVVGIGAFVGATEGLSLVATAVVAVAFQPARKRVQGAANRLVYGDRATPYEALAEFSQRMGEAYATEEILPRMAGVLGRATGASSTEVWLREGSALQLVASWPEPGEPEGSSKPLSSNDLPVFAGVDVAVPVRHQGELLGALTLTKPPNEALTPAEGKLVADLASQAGLLLRNVALIADLKASRQRLVAAQDEERRRLERNLHDGAQQQFVALAVQLGLAETLARKDPERTAQMLSALKARATEALDDLRDLAHGIYPPLLADKGLAAALEAQARKAAVPTSVDAATLGRYPREVEAAAYFCCLESLQNVAKYARATSAIVKLEELDGFLAFSVADDGVGFRTATTRRGSGTTNMLDRVEALGGALDVRSSPGRGTTVTGRIPSRTNG